VTPVEVINRLAATTSRTEKEQIILDAWMSGCLEFFRGARFAYDALMPFYVKKVAEIIDEGITLPEIEALHNGYGWPQFEDLALRLHRRQLTGHAARDAINEAALAAPVEMWNGFYRRILLKDLRAGIEEKTINKVLDKLADAYPEAKRHRIPVFTCQLAHDSAKHESKLTGKKMLDVKLDGVRLITVLDKGSRTVQQFTRDGRLNDNFPHITEALSPLVDRLPTSIVLDGEITSHTFQDLMTRLNRKDKLDTSANKLALFDVLPLDGFRAGYYSMAQRDRHTVLCGLIPEFQTLTSGSVYVLPKLNVDLDTPEGQASCKEFNREAIEAGYEGIMFKDPDAPYEAKRSTAWLKAKPWIEVSLEIVEVIEGTGKYVGMMGALKMRGEEDGKAIETNVGSGFSDDERVAFWQHRQEYVGYIGEVRADAITKEQGSDVWSLRFPRWKGLRGTRKGEKL
jgi:DNA ligase-1